MLLEPAAVNNIHSIQKIWSNRPRFLRNAISACLAAFTVIGGSSAIVQAQEPSANSQYTLPYQDDVSGSAMVGYGNPNNVFNQYQIENDEPNVVGGAGFKGRAGHEAGRTVGRTQAITYFDLSPFVYVDDLVLFGEGRLNVGNNGRVAGNLGAGARYYFDRTNSIIGASGWWDIDESRGPKFQQWGVSGEFLSEYLDIRGNWYNPTGETFQIVDQRFEAGSQHFIDRPLADVNPGEAQGTYLAFQRRVFTATVLKGFDTLFSMPIPGELAQRFNLEAGAGFYNYKSTDDSIDEVWGWRVRMDGDILERTSHMFLEVMHDKTFKTNVLFGIDINYWQHLGHRQRIGHSQHHRLAEWVRRNRTMVAFEGSFLAEPETAINPRTGNPYVIYQVNTTAPAGGNGTLGNPFNNLNNAMAVPGADIVFVQGNSVITEAVSIDRDYLQIIGEQTVPTIQLAVQNLSGNILMPTISAPGFSKPVIEGVTGDYAVRYNANNTRFAGIDINNFTGTGAESSGAIVAMGRGFGGGEIVNTLDSVTVRNVQDANGIYLENNTGTFEATNVGLINIAGLDAIQVRGDNGSPSNLFNLVFTGDNNQINNTDAALGAHRYSVQLVDVRGSVNLSTLLIEDQGGAGIRVVGTDPNNVPATALVSFGDIVLNGTQILDPNEGAVYIGDFNGGVNFSNLVINQLGGNDGDAFVVRNLRPRPGVANSGVVTVSGQTNIQNRRGHGILIEDLLTQGSQTGVVRFVNSVNVNGLGTGFTGTDAAVKFDSASGTLNFMNTLTINGSLGNGVEIVDIADDGLDTFGRFVSDGLITINNANYASFGLGYISKENFDVRTNGIVINNRGLAGNTTNARGYGVAIAAYNGSATFGGLTSVFNQNGAVYSAIDVRSNTDFTDEANPVLLGYTNGAINFNSVNVEGQAGATSYGVLVQDNIKEGGVNFGSVNVTGTNSRGVLLQDNAIVNINGGVLAITGGRAIEVLTVNGVPPDGNGNVFQQRQQHSVVLQSVSATNADYGILVDQSEGAFTVTGLNSAPGSGGTISGMTGPAGSAPTNPAGTGAFFNDTQAVSLQNMNFNGNVRGVVANNLLTNRNGAIAGLALNGLSINASGGEGIYAQDVSSFRLENSSLTSNGVTRAQEAIELVATQNQADVDGDGILDDISYDFRILNNNIQDSLTTVVAGDMILVRTANNIPGPVTLNLFVQNNGNPADLTSTNSLSANRTGGAALAVEWQGTANGTISGNQISAGNGANQRGIELIVTGNGDFDIAGNSIQTGGANAIGISGLFTGSSIVFIRDHQQLDEDGFLIPNSGIVMNGANSTGIDLSFLSSNNEIDISNNLIQLTSPVGTGVRFSRIFGNNGDTTVTLNGNTIDLYPNNNSTVFTTERGFHFVDVRGVITLIGTVNNTVFPSNNPPRYVEFATLFPSQTGGTTVIVNGNAVPN